MAAVLEKKAPLSGEALPPGELPFDVSKHPTCKVAHAQRSLSRWSEDMAFFRDRAASTKQYSLKLKTGGQWPSLDALAQLQKKVAALKESDEAAVSEALTVLLKAAGAVEETSSEECLRYSLLRYCGQEPEVWFEFLFGTLLSGKQKEDWQTVNPFLGDQELQLLSDLAVLVMLRASRLGLLSRSLEELSRVQVQVQALEAGEPLESRRLLLAQASASLAATLRSKRAYAPGDLEGSYDPRFLAFEFTRNLLLRENQVNLVQDFISTLENKEGGSAMVKQMIMGQGKTTVVCPMLVLMLANGEQLVVLVVPSALLDMSRRVLRSTFASVLTKDVGTFECERSSAFDPHLLKKLEKAKQSGAAVVTVPTSVKSLMLRMLELMFKLQAKGKEANDSVTETRSQVRQLSKALSHFRHGAILMDEVDVVLHPLKSELNFPYGPKEPLDGSSPRAFRWTLPMHLFEALFLGQAVLKANGKLPPHLEAQLSGAQGTRYKEIAVGLSKRIAKGYASKALQASPHLVLLEEEFFNEDLKPLLTEWLLMWLRSQGVMDAGGNAQKLRTATVSSYLMRGSDQPAAKEEEEAFKDLPAAEMKMLNLAHAWLSLLLPHCLAKIDRVSFGIMTSEDLTRALEADPNMPLSRGKLAIPFIGKDVPSPTNEFAHPDIVIGLTILGYRYENLRLADIDEVMVRLLNDVRKEPGRAQDRPSAVLYRTWVTEAGGFLCDPSVPDAPKQSGKGVPPLALLQRSNETQMKDIFKLLCGSTSVIQWYLEQLVFPKYMRRRISPAQSVGPTALLGTMFISVTS
ncbi:unnamed protein product [Effrenium voratum]|nr:unnamed protein product [Effrenium voratum]